MDQIITHYFLGANTPEGFYSLYNSYVSENDRLMIIKGSPGSGKSTFMKTLAKEISGRGIETELIHCSGDPESLDGVYFPALNIAYVDGTSPHVIEPRYAGVWENYISFGECLDMDMLWVKRDAIKELNRAYKGEYSKAYAALAAAKAVKSGILDELIDDSVRNAVNKKVTSLVKYELEKTNRTPTVKERFIDAFTCKGWIHRYDTVDALAEKIYVVDSELGLNYLYIRAAAEQAVNRGWNVILCRDPLFPDKLSGIIIPGASLAILSEYAKEQLDLDTKAIRLDSIPDHNKIKQLKTRLKERSSIWDKLIEDSRAFLAKANEYHNMLEQEYKPFVDFSVIDSITEKHLKILRLKSEAVI